MKQAGDFSAVPTAELFERVMQLVQKGRQNIDARPLPRWMRKRAKHMFDRTISHSIVDKWEAVQEGRASESEFRARLINILNT